MRRILAGGELDETLESMNAEGYAAFRPYVTPQSLDELTGPTGGEITLPGNLDWGPRRTYDLDDPADVRIFYMRVVRESARPEDLSRFLNARVLRQFWSQLILTPRTRAMWESRFPDLRHAA
jgi:hypothetical protein